MKKALYSLMVFGLIALLMAAGCGGGGDFNLGGGSPVPPGTPPYVSPPSYSISGTVSGAVSAGVFVALDGFSDHWCYWSTYTGSSGNYTFNLLANGSYTVTPYLTGYTFDPAHIKVTINGADITGMNFVASLDQHSISGTVSGAISADVRINLTGAGTSTTTTDGSGNYIFAGLADGSYTLTPSMAGYTFNPISMAVTVNSADVTGNDFIASIYTGPYIYVTDSNNNRIVQMHDMAGVGWTTLSTYSGWDQFYYPSDIFVDAAGRIYVADLTPGNHRIVRMDDMSGTPWTRCCNWPNQFYGPQGIFVDTAGKIYVADSGNSRIVRMDDMSGANWTTFGTSGSGTNQFHSPEGIFVDTAGKIYVTDLLNNRIVRMDDMSGANWTTFGTSGSGTNQFHSPEGIFVDTAGKIYVADSGNSRIVRMDDMSGTNWTTLGTYGFETNQFFYPGDIFVDAAGKIYVTDSSYDENNRIVRTDDMSGTNWTTFGTYGSGTNQFSGPRGIFVR